VHELSLNEYPVTQEVHTDDEEQIVHGETHALHIPLSKYSVFWHLL
jgi:hypothetical protein